MRFKHYIKLIICISYQLIFTSRLTAQNLSGKSSLICSYQLSYQLDSTDATIRKESFTLVVEKGISRFQSPRSHTRDSLFSNMINFIKQPTLMDAYTKQLMQFSTLVFRYIIYKDEAAGKIDYYDWVGTKLYHYEEKYPLFKWNITPLIASINGYKCQKATTFFAGRTFEAWFTREVPVSDGPYKFSGLPGLIIKIGDTRKQYTFELTSLKQSSLIPTISLPIGSIVTTTKADLRRGQLAYRESLAGSSPTFGNLTAPSISSADKQKIIMSNKKKNNFIELK